MLRPRDSIGNNGAGDLRVPYVRGVTPNGRGRRLSSKFMLSLSQDCLKTVSLEANSRGISVQELIRAVIIPDWVKGNVRRQPNGTI
jgi:hypothetical protein